MNLIKNILLVWSLSVFLFPISSIQTVNAYNDAKYDIGKIPVPKAIEKTISSSGSGPEDIAILFFVSNMVTLITTIAGLWSAVNIVLAGFTYITNNGKADSHEKVKNQILMSIIGLVFILTAYSFAGILGLVLFGKADIFLKPTIETL